MSNSETRVCQNCQKSFVIDAQDFDFYNKINVPPPTWCPECRLIRRCTFRNIRNLYKRTCDLTDKNIISIYSPDKDLIVYDYDVWYSDKWDPLDYGKDHDFSKPFFEQFRELLHKVPLPHVMAVNRINSEYTSNVAEVKNCYLIWNGERDEDCAYGEKIFFCKDCIDNYLIYNNELCYENINTKKCYKSVFLENCNECSDTLFSYDCRNCSNILFCSNLRHKDYYIFNKKYTKEEFLNKKKEILNGSYSQFLKCLEQYQEVKRKAIRRPLIFHSINCTGDEITHSKNCRYCFEIDKVENSKYITFVDHDLKDSMDITNCQIGELSYEAQSSGRGAKILFSAFAWVDNDTSYSFMCLNCVNIFGCIGLRNKSYCILNKQYTKEEYEKLVPKIIQHMNKMPYIDKKGRVYKYGEFFPPELSPFSYNETIAQEYFPLTREQALKQGYSWKDPEERDYQIDIKPPDLPDHIKDVKDDILGKVIECQHQGKCQEQCTTAFKIIPQELQFYKRMNLPLPRLCPNCRHYQRLKQRNPLKLWHRKCMCQGQTSVNGVYKNTIEHFHAKEPCPNEFETSYAPDRPEIVYCEKCYLAEVV